MKDQLMRVSRVYLNSPKMLGFLTIAFRNLEPRFNIHQVNMSNFEYLSFPRLFMAVVTYDGRKHLNIIV